VRLHQEMRWRSGLGTWSWLVFAACGNAQPAPATPISVAVPPRLQDPGADEAASSPERRAAVPTVEHRVSWYGLSVDLGDAWHDATNYTFEGPQLPVDRLSFSRSGMPPTQVVSWLEEVRRRLDGAYGSKPSAVQQYENPNFSVLGVHFPIKTESLYDLFVTVDEQVLNISVMCRAECDATVRGIVRSLSKPADASAVAPGQQRYSVMSLVFDSVQPLELPKQFSLDELNGDPESLQHHIWCSRSSSPPEDSELPSAIHWAYEADKALAQVPRSEEPLISKPGNVSMRLYRREGFVPDELGKIVFASSSSAVVTIDRDYFVCHLLALPSSAPLLARFHRLFESARRE
jgi:hypothetical protein